jgi:toxin ParE1/3/4
MRLVIRDEAAHDLEQIFEWISKDSPTAAADVIRGLRERMNTILVRETVNMGRKGPAPSTRELVEPPYVIVYQIPVTDDDPDVVTILSVVHGARDR